MSQTLLRLAKRGAIVLAMVLLAGYGAVLALLYAEQRDMLFVRGRVARAPDPIYQVRRIAEADGTRLTLWQAPRSGAPVIVFFYGNAGTLSDFAQIGEAFHAEGYGVLLASYRGYSGNPGNPSEDGLMRDARAALSSLPAGHGPVVLWGQSLGSGVAARMASEGRGAVLILQSPYTAVVDVAARFYPYIPVHWLMRDRFDTLSLAGRIRMPVLIMSGTADRTVPFDMGETLAGRLGERATLVPFPGGGHVLPEAGVFKVAETWLRRREPAQ
jgi:hypothetical protein